MNLREEIEKIKAEGYNEANAEARLCQDNFKVVPSGLQVIIEKQVNKGD